MTTDLGRLEALEFQTLGLISRLEVEGNTTTAARLHKRLGEFRAAKARWLSRRHPNLLRKASVENTGDGTEDPDGVLDDGAAYFRSPEAFCDMTISTACGPVTVGRNGVVATHESQTALHAELRARGFTRMTAVNAYGTPTGKAAGADPVSAFRPSALQKYRPSFYSGIGAK
jgi:hypothetical protein